MRGFERFIGAPGVLLADGSTKFKQALRRAMNSPPCTLSSADVEARRTVLWDSCLKPLPALVASMAAEVKA
jgi:hypothetical protein